MLEPQTLKGFRDFLPANARKRQYVMSVLRQVYESFGFEPLETPALEYEEILLGKYGEEGDKLLYRFVDNGERRVALRYDQTVPLARVVAQYQNDLPTIFKRYQIQPVWRAENPQKGRFREFMQCDADITGSSSTLSDAEVIAVAVQALKRLGFTKYKILINDRSIFEGVPVDVIRGIDKLKKIGFDQLLKELVQKGYNEASTAAQIEDLRKKSPTPRLTEIFSHLANCGVSPEDYEFSPILARGLDYYTGLIFEIEIEGYTAGSVAGGGRYDNLIGMFINRQVPAVGFAFGFDRLLEAMEVFQLFPQNLTSKALVTIFSPDLKDKSLELSSKLRTNGINCELYLDEQAKMDKQLKYAHQKQIPFVLIMGPDELSKNVIAIKNMQSGEQTQVSLDDLIKLLTAK